MKPQISASNRASTIPAGFGFASCTWLAVIAICLLLANAQASSLLQEGFNYNSGGTLAGNGSWLNSSTYITVGSSDLSYSGFADLAGTSDAAVASFAGTTPAQYTTATFNSAVSSGTVYASFLLNVLTLASAQDYSSIGMLKSTGNGGTFNAANDPLDMAIKSVNGLTYTLGIRAYGSGVGAVYASPALTPNTTELIVFKYEFATKKSFIFINPTISDVEGTPSASCTGTTTAPDIGLFYLRAAGNVLGPANPSFQIDDLRIGTSWTDVVVAVPEPSAFALMGLALLAVGFSRLARK